MKKEYNFLSDFNRERFYPEITDSIWYDYKWHLREINGLKNNIIKKYLEEGNKEAVSVMEKFGFAVTPYFYSLIDHDNFYTDPLAKQVMPHAGELVCNDLLNADPFKENNSLNSPLPGLIKRYPDRVVLVTTSSCPSLCRYCTRKWNWKEGYNLTDEDFFNIIEYLKNNRQIKEVIISGGETFLLSNSRIEFLLSAISSLDSIENIRIGSRILSFLPYRIDDELISILEKFSPLWIISHFNHPSEITKDTYSSVRKLQKAGVAVCNQSVLLKGVNDEAEVFKRLNYRLLQNMIKPYYLFYPDLVEGTAHFVSSVQKGIDIMESIRGECSGLSIPQFVVDLPDGGKVPLLPEYIIEHNDGSYKFRNYEKKVIDYKEVRSI